MGMNLNLETRLAGIRIDDTHIYFTPKSNRTIGSNSGAVNSEEYLAIFAAELDELGIKPITKSEPYTFKKVHFDEQNSQVHAKAKKLLKSFFLADVIANHQAKLPTNVNINQLEHNINWALTANCDQNFLTPYKSKDCDDPSVLTSNSFFTERQLKKQQQFREESEAKKEQDKEASNIRKIHKI